ncbi:hypothetical protein, variant 2 [Aphanomyces astaci]|nr:hypothetical protein, variant 1 [Aphanomyces astaci]XP_009830043.1 hypothetical protein, variant 2 [Aphanomyces astaci]ETV80118.1 hypothetical protein, variant 1 [Aphanomyces astaci]ETV80119.1 hypothetical protein, variant 2 [Aphanomyces astaci]|eukprot:XP_009830042.1 hypothetical protein, variant 1 [Aphanomyces astaci]
MQIVDAKRTSWFDMITQYSAIFGHHQVQGRVDAALCAWAVRTVSDLTRLLETVLPNVVEFNAIATIMEQVLFFGGSLGRVGVDFRGLVLVIFQSHVVARVTTQWTDAVDAFDAALSMQGGGAIMIQSFRPVSTPVDPTGGDSSVAPPSIMTFPALAQLTNAILTSFNDLRLCALLSLQYRLSLCLQQSMARVVVAVGAFCRRHALTPDEVADNMGGGGGQSSKVPLEVQVFRLIQVMHTAWVPYIIRSFHKLFTEPKGRQMPTALDEANGPQEHTSSPLPRRHKTLELVLDDESDEPEVPDVGKRRDIGGLPSQGVTKSSYSGVAVEMVLPSTSETLRFAGGPQLAATQTQYIEDLIRDFFRTYQITAALDAFECERPIVDASKALDRGSLGLDVTDGGGYGQSRLESFVQSWNQVEHGVEFVKQPTARKPKKKKTPPPSALAISPLPTGTAPPVPEVNEPVAEWDLGVPGCTPKPRIHDLKSFGFDDVDDLSCPTSPGVATPSSPVLDKLAQRSKTTTSSSQGKKVSIGEDGSTPKKQYIFYRETPPSFVTESEEAAREVMEKLSLDPQYDIVPPEAQQRFVELSSSEVSKYAVGKRVEGLGATRSICGIVSKTFGSKLCGTSGPGTIVIDTQPEVDASPVPSATGLTCATSFSAEDEALIDALLESN